MKLVTFTLDEQKFCIDTDSYMTFVYNEGHEGIFRQMAKMARALQEDKHIKIDKERFKAVFTELRKHLNNIKSDPEDNKFRDFYNKLYENTVLKYSNATIDQNNMCLMMTQFRFQDGYASPAERFFEIKSADSYFLEDDDIIEHNQFHEMEKWTEDRFVAEYSDDPDELISLMKNHDGIIYERCKKDLQLMKDICTTLIQKINKMEENDPDKSHLIKILKNLIKDYKDDSKDICTDSM